MSKLLIPFAHFKNRLLTLLKKCFSLSTFFFIYLFATHSFSLVHAATCEVQSQSAPGFTIDEVDNELILSTSGYSLQSNVGGDWRTEFTNEDGELVRVCACNVSGTSVSCQACSDEFSSGDCPLGGCSSARQVTASNGSSFELLFYCNAIVPLKPVATTFGECQQGGLRGGNPCDLVTGNKFQREIDYVDLHDLLSVSRNYNSMANSLANEFDIVDVGLNWTIDFGEILVVDTQQSGSNAVFVNSDGNSVEFEYQSGNYVPKVNKRYSLSQSGSDYIVTFPNTETIIFGPAGIVRQTIIRPVSRTNNKGQTVSYNYVNNNLDNVTDEYGRSLQFTYNANNRIETITDPDGNVYTYSYLGGNRNLHSVTYPDDTPSDLSNNPVREYTYTSNRLSEITAETGNILSRWGYSNGRVTSSVTGQNKNVIVISYDDINNTTTVTDDKGGSHTITTEEVNGSIKVKSVTGGICPYCSGENFADLTYDANGYIASRTDYEGNQTTYQNNSRGLEISRTEAFGTAEARTITTDWHPTFNVPEKITEPGKETTFTYNPRGQVLTRTIKDLSTNNTRQVIFTYDTITGNVSSINGPRTDVLDEVVFTYDAMGNVATRSEDPDGNGPAAPLVTQFTSYDNSGRLLSFTDPNGVVTDFTYDPRGRLLSREVAPGTTYTSTTSFQYNELGDVSRITYPDASYLDFTYDPARNITIIENNFGETLEYDYDDFSNAERAFIDGPGPGLFDNSSVYNDHNLLTEDQSASDSFPFTYEYDENGNLTSLQDPTKPVPTLFEYDELQRLITKTDPDSNNIRYEYDARDNVTKVIDARGLETVYTYNGFDDFIQMTSPDIGTITYQYDSAGNVIQETDQKSNVKNYTYDALNRRTSITYPSNPDLDVTFIYDQNAFGKGRLSQMHDAVGLTVYNYNFQGDLVSKTVGIDSQDIQGITIPAQSHITGYGYDSARNLINLSYPTSDRVITYSRDAFGRVSMVDSSEGGAPEVLADQITYQPFGPIKDLTFANGITQTRSYDLDYRTTNIVAGAVQNLAYTINDAGNIDMILDGATPSVQTFTYDNLDRLRTASGSYGLLTYNYDATGNRISFDDQVNLDTYNYDTLSNRLIDITGANAKTIGYDDNGNITLSGGQVYTYGTQNRMETFMDSDSNATYMYNGVGERVIKVVNDEVTIFHYDEDGNIIAESNQDGVRKREYAYIDGDRLALFQPTVVSATAPTSRSLLVNTVGTIFASVLNVENYAIEDCEINLASTNVPLVVEYRGYNPATNQFTGALNEPVDIPASNPSINDFKTGVFLIALTPTGAFNTTDIELEYICDNAVPAPSIIGVNSIQLTGSSGPTADIIASATTADLVLVNNNTSIFAVASTNVGQISDTITVELDTGENTALINSLDLSVCEIDSQGACINTPGASVQNIQMNVGDSKSFAIFATALSPITPPDPATKRIFVRFIDSNGVVVGAASTAVSSITTQF